MLPIVSVTELDERNTCRKSISIIINPHFQLTKGDVCNMFPFKPIEESAISRRWVSFTPGARQLLWRQSFLPNSAKLRGNRGGDVGCPTIEYMVYSSKIIHMHMPPRNHMGKHCIHTKAYIWVSLKTGYRKILQNRTTIIVSHDVFP